MMSELPELTAAGPKYESGKKLTIVKKENLGWLTSEEANEILHRVNCYEDLVKACEKAHWLFNVMVQEGYLNDDNNIIPVLEAALAHASQGGAGLAKAKPQAAGKVNQEH